MFTLILDYVDEALQTFVFDLWAIFTDAISELAFILWTIYLLMLTYKTLIKKDLGANGFAWKFFISAILLTIVLSLDNLIFLVYGAAVEIPEAIANLFFQTLGENENSISVSMDDLWERGLAIASKYWELGGLRNIAAAIFAAILTAVLFGFTVISVGQLGRAKILLGICLALAPFAILAYMFDETRYLFDGWKRKVTALILIPIMVYAGLVFLAALLISTTDDLHNFTVGQNQILSYTMIGAYILVNGFAIYTMKDIHKSAAELVGTTPMTASNFGKHTRALGGFAYGKGKAMWNNRRGNK